MDQNRFLPRDKAAELLLAILSADVRAAYDPEKHRLALLDETGEAQVYFRLPITVPYPTDGIPEPTTTNYVILLIQSGSCAVGYFENGRCLNHKVFRSYMVRKKQGKSQIKYLKTKGKSRAGSRVRLGETLEFFENINERLQTYFKQHEIHRIAISCSITLLPYLYGSATATPFDKRDPRLFKIPKHIHTPIYEVLLDANRFLQRGELIAASTSATGQPLTGFASFPVLHDFLQHGQNDGYTAGMQHNLAELEDEVYLKEEWDEDEFEEDDSQIDDDDEDDDIVEWD